MKKNNLIFLLLYGISFLSHADTYPKNPKVDIINYAFEIVLSDDTDEIVSKATIDVLYKGAGVTQLRLDLVKVSEALNQKGMTVDEVLLEGKPLKYSHAGDSLIITLPKISQVNQRSTYEISYSGIPASGLKIGDNKYGDRTFFSDNWPNRGRNWLPMVDHPYDKATCEFIITAPSHYQVVSNGLKAEETDLGNGYRLTHWKQSVPIATWLYVLGVARFAVQYVDEFDHKSIQTWVYYQDREPGFYDFAVPTKSALEFYSENVGPFVYEKLANIQSNSVGGGMEAASAILYSDKSVVGDRNERWRNIVIHEIAHQWFGNSVTEYDWDDVWLSEGFATYFTALFIQHEYGQQAFMDKLESSKNTVYNFYEKNPDYRIVHNNLQDMTKVTSSHTYQKGSWILHMLRGLVGEENFWKGIQSYYSKYMNSNATTADFRNEMESASGMDLEWFFEQWLYKPGALKIEGSWKYNSRKNEISIKLNQTQNDGSLFRMPLEIAIYENGNSEPVVHVVDLKDKKHSYTLTTDFRPEKVVLDPDRWVLMQATFKKD